MSYSYVYLKRAIEKQPSDKITQNVFKGEGQSVESEKNKQTNKHVIMSTSPFNIDYLQIIILN